jgi:hypothetical protein
MASKRFIGMATSTLARARSGAVSTLVRNFAKAMTRVNRREDKAGNIPYADDNVNLTLPGTHA